MRALLVISLLFADAISLRLLAETVGGVALLTGLLGAFAAGVALIQRQGLRTLQALRAAVQADAWPARVLWDGLLVLVAALLLMLPGAVSDVLALLLLLPSLRRRLTQHFGTGANAPVVLEGEFRERPPPSLERDGGTD